MRAFFVFLPAMVVTLHDDQSGRAVKYMDHLIPQVLPQSGLWAASLVQCAWGPRCLRRYGWPFFFHRAGVGGCYEHDPSAP